MGGVGHLVFRRELAFRAPDSHFGQLELDFGSRKAQNARIDETASPKIEFQQKKKVPRDHPSLEVLLKKTTLSLEIRIVSNDDRIVNNSIIIQKS